MPNAIKMNGFKRLNCNPEMVLLALSVSVSVSVSFGFGLRF
jgi:hypothetical protein